MIDQVKTSGATCDNDWRRVVQRLTTSNMELQRMVLVELKPEVQSIPQKFKILYAKYFMQNLRITDKNCIQNSDLLWIFNPTFSNIFIFQ